jgi:hypothetical protein
MKCKLIAYIPLSKGDLEVIEYETALNQLAELYPDDKSKLKEYITPKLTDFNIKSRPTIAGKLFLIDYLRTLNVGLVSKT